MAWDAKSARDSRKSTSLLRLFKSKKDLAVGDAFPKLDFSSPIVPVTATDLPTAMDHEEINSSSVFKEHSSPPPGAPLTVHVTIQYTDPVIRSRYSRSYTSSHTFEPTNRICNGLLRRIDHCSKELLTRKDSSALDQYKDGTNERKCMRFEITFRIVRRGVGEWAERRFRSYQKQPLTVGLTKDIQLATHRIVGLFLRRHDKDFQWLDGSIIDHSPEAPETALPSSDVRHSLLCVPRSRFFESRQSFEFVPGYTIQLSFRSRNARRATPVVKSTIKVDSSQPAPLSLLMSEEIQWKGLQAINHGLEERKRELYTHIGICHATNCPHSEDDALQIELSISNNLGIQHHVYREIRSNFALFRDPEARDCNEFLHSIKKSLIEASEHTDAKINKLDDFEFNVVELKGRSWSVRNPLKFSQGPSASYGRRTVQAALDRIQTGIGDVLRGNNVAVHISARKRGHLVLDKAIIAREKRGTPAEMFSSAEEQRTAFIARLKTRIERDMEMVFKDTCSIDAIPDDTDDILEQRSPGPEAGHLETRSGSIRSMSPTSSRQGVPHSSHDSPQASPTKPAVQRAFSLSGRSVSSAASIISAKNIDEFRSMDMVSESGSRRSSMSLQDQPLGERLFRDTPSPSPSPMKPQRRFSLLPRNYSSQSTRVSSASTLICETPSVLEESPQINVAQRSSQEEQTVKAKVLDTDKFAETDGLPDISKVNSMTLNDVADSKTGELAGMVPTQALGILENDLSPALLSHAEVIVQEEAADLDYFKEEEKTQNQCDHADVDRLVTGMGESEAKSEEMDYNRHQHTIMDAFQDAQEYATAGLSLHAMSLAAAAAAAKVDGLKSPGIDEYSTAPSTPALSLGGGSSPRPSLLATPGFDMHREEAISGTKGEEEDRIFEPESDVSEEADERTDIMEPATDASGDQRQPPTDTPSDFGDDFGLGDSIEHATEQSVAEAEIPMLLQQQQQEPIIDSPAIVDKDEISGPEGESPLSDTASDVTEGAAAAETGEPILQDQQPATVPSDGNTRPMAEVEPEPEPTAASASEDDDITCSDPIEPPNGTNAKEKETDRANLNQQPLGSDKDETQDFGAENVAPGPDEGDLGPPDILGGEVRSGPAPVSATPGDDSDANLFSDNGTEELGLPPVGVGLDSDTNPFLLLVYEVEEAASHGHEKMPTAGPHRDSDANPFVLLVDEVENGPESTPDPDGNENEVFPGAEGQIDSATGIESADRGDLEGPGWIKVGSSSSSSAPAQPEGKIPDEDETSGFAEPQPTPDPEVTENVPEQDAPGSGTTPDNKEPQQPFIAPTGSAVVHLEAEILAAAAINNLIAGGEEMFRVDPAFIEPEPGETEWRFETTPEPEPEPESEPESEPVVAPEEEEKKDHPRQANIDASQQTDDQSILNKDIPAAAAPEEDEEKQVETTLAASGSAATAAADPDTYPDDIGQPEVAQLQARLLLGEDYSSTGPQQDNSVPLDDAHEREKDDEEIENNEKEVEQTEGNFSAVIVGILDPNIGSDPDLNVVFRVIADADGDGQLHLQLQEQEEQQQQQKRVSNRRASELGEDICGHEYSTGSNRVGYAAVCLTGPPELDVSLVDEAAPDTTDSAVDEDQNEALAEGDWLEQPLADANTQAFITDPGARQVNQVPPVVVGVIKQVLTGQLSEVREQPDGGAARYADEASKAAAETSFSPSETEDPEATPAIITVITDDGVPSEKEAESRDASHILPEMAEDPPAVVVDLIKRVLTGESEAGLPDHDKKHMDIQAALGELEREIEAEAGLSEEEKEIRDIQAELGQLRRKMEVEAAPDDDDALAGGMSEPAPTVFMILGQEEGPEEMAATTTVLGPTGPEDTTCKIEAQTVEDFPPRVIPAAAAVPDISNPVRHHHAHVHVATESFPVSAGISHISVKDFEAGPVSSGPSSNPVVGPSAAAEAGDEETETPRANPSPVFFTPIISVPVSVDDDDSQASSSKLTVPDPLNLGYDTVGISARGSVDTIRRFSFNDDEEEDNEPCYPPSRPQTAGYLGLGDANRRLKVLGVFGSSGGNGNGNGDIAGTADGSSGRARRYSLPLHYLLDNLNQQQQEQNYHQDFAQDGGAGWKGKGKANGKVKEKSKSRSPRTSWAKLMGLEVETETPGEEEQQKQEKKHEHHRFHKTKRAALEDEQQQKDAKMRHGDEEPAASASHLTEESSAEQAAADQIYDGPTVVPRIMMLLAGVVAVGKIIKGPAAGGAY